MKECIRCNESKSLEAFRFRKATNNYYGYCKDCQNILSKESRNRLSENGTKKYCRTCKGWLLLDAFQAYSSGNLYNSCKVCTIELVRSGSTKRKQSVIIENTKLCMICFELIDISNFKPSSRGIGGLGPYCIPCQKIYHQKRYDPQKSKEQSYRWRKENRATYLAQHRLNQFNRKSLIKAKDDGTLDSKYIKEIYNREICCYCNRATPECERTLDHIIPLSRGGLHSIINVDMACINCNSSKREFLIREWKDERFRHPSHIRFNIPLWE